MSEKKWWVRYMSEKNGVSTLDEWKKMVSTLDEWKKGWVRKMREK